MILGGAQDRGRLMNVPRDVMRRLGPDFGNTGLEACLQLLGLALPFPVACLSAVWGRAM